MSFSARPVNLGVSAQPPTYLLTLLQLARVGTRVTSLTQGTRATRLALPIFGADSGGIRFALRDLPTDGQRAAAAFCSSTEKSVPKAERTIDDDALCPERASERAPSQGQRGAQEDDDGGGVRRPSVRRWK